MSDLAWVNVRHATVYHTRRDCFARDAASVPTLLLYARLAGLLACTRCESDRAA